jgi:hypothetical protein
MISAESLRSNTSLLKLDLYCKGLRMADSCFIEEDGGRKILRTRAGLGSGLELILPGNMWTNVPVSEGFAAESPYVLEKIGSRYSLTWSGQPIVDVTLSPRPEWYDAHHHRQDHDQDRYAAGNVPRRVSRQSVRVLAAKARA